MLVLAIVVQPVAAEILPGATERITQLSQAFGKLGLEGDFLQASVIASDMLFVLEELERLSSLAGQVEDDLTVCGDPKKPSELSLQMLGSPECLSVLLGAERARWRTSAELSAQIHLLARYALIETLPLVGLEDLEGEARDTAIAWWQEAGPATLEAYARIGREWIKKVEAESEEDVEEAKAEILDSLDRIALEPGALHLRQVLSQTQSQEALREAFMPLMEEANLPAEELAKLKAAAQFAGGVDSLMSQQIWDIYGQNPVETCSALQELALEWDPRLPPLESHCVSAVALMQEITNEEGDLAADAFQQILVLAFEERILTMRLLLAKLSRVNTLEGDSSCSDAMGLLNSSLDDKKRRPLGRKGLDKRLIEQAAGGFARLSQACLTDSSPRWLAESCDAGRKPQEITNVFARMPARIGNRLKPKWSTLVDVANDQTLGRMCNDPIKFLKEVGDGTYSPSDALRAAVEDLTKTAEEVMWQTSLKELRPYLDGFELPVQVFDDLAGRADLLCSEIVEILPPNLSGDATKPQPLTAQMLQATLVDAGVLLSDGKRPEELTTLCQVLSKRERAKDGTPLIELLKDAEKDAEAIATSAADVQVWVQSIMDRLNQDGERIAKRFAAGLVVATGVDQVRQVLSISNEDGEDLRCNAASLQDKETDEPIPSLAPGIKISNFTSQLDTSGATWNVALSAQVNLMLCGPIPHDQEDAENGVAGGQMQRARSIEAATALLNLKPILLDLPSDANKIAEDFVAKAREAAKKIEINEDVLLGALTDYLRVAGISDLKVIRSFESAGVEFEWDERGWARVRTTIDSPLSSGDGYEVSSVDLCLLLPIFAEDLTDEDASCIPIDRLEDKMTEILLENVLQPVLTKVLSDLDMSLEGSFEQLGIKPIISSGYAQTKGSNIPTVVSKIVLKSDELKKLAGYGAEEDAPFYGHLVVNLKIPPDGRYEIKTTLPRLSDDYFLNLLPELSEAGLLQLAEVPKLPGGASAREKKRCDPEFSKESPRRIYRLALTEESPIVGVLGFVCLELKQDPYYVAPRNGELRTLDDAWRLVFQTGDDIEFVELTGDKPENLLRIELELRVSEPSFEQLDGRSVAVEFNLETGVWRLPADERANREAYSIIEEQLSRQLPHGIRVYGVEFSSNGIKLLLTPPDAEQVFANLENGILSDVDLDALKSIANTACEMAPLLGLAEMIGSGSKTGALLDCDYDSLVHELEIRGAEIAWSCTESGIDNQLRKCDIVFDEDLTICEDRLNIGVTWNSSREPEFEDEELVECLEDHIADVFPDSIDPRIKVDPPKLSANCVAEPARCSITAGVTADFSDAFEDVNVNAFGLDATTCGGLSAELVAKMNAKFGFDGTSRIWFQDADRDFDAALNQCVADISLAVATAAVKAADSNADIDSLLDDAATHGSELLLATSAELNEITGEAVECKLDLRNSTSPDCEELSRDILRQGSLRGVRFTSEYSIFDTNVEIRVGFAFDQAALSPEAILTGHTQPERMWEKLRDSAKVKFDLGCKGQSNSECLSEIGDKLANDLPGDIVSYNGGLQIEPGPDRTTIKIPLSVKYDEFRLEFPVVVDCGLETPGWNQISLNCSSDPEAVILEAVAQALATLPDVELDLGLASVSLSDPEFKVDQGLISMKAVASFEGLDLLPEGFEKAQGTVTIGRDLVPDVQIGWDALVNGASEHLAEAVNGLVGDFLPVKIVNVKIDRMNPDTGIPEKIGIESVATIIEVISLSAPRLVLSERGLEFDGPNQFSIELPDGFSIPVPPIAICPNGGAIEDKELTLTANITIGECTASGILKFAGSVTVLLDRPRVETLGKLVVLTVLPLGHSKGFFDLGERLISHETEIGGVMSDIIRMRTKFDANGKLMTVTANGDIDVFNTRVGEGDFNLNLDTGVLNTNFNADIGIAKGQGFIRTGTGFSRPEAEIDGHMGIGGFPVMGSFIKSRARFAKVGISIFGLRLAVAFPGLDLLDPDKIADLLKDLLTPNFENLDEALEALLSGNITMNPFADFGSGGDGMGDSSDGDAGESAGGDGAKDGGKGDPGEDLGNEEAPAEADTPEGPAPPVPSEGVAAGGLAGTETAPLWFAIDRATRHVRIGTGTQGGDDEKIVALTVHHKDHFDEAGTRKGKTLVLLDRGYTQILPSTSFASEPCEGAGQQNRIVALYAGTDAPRQGMYELCRLRDANDTPVTESFFGQADEKTLRDVASLQDALAAELLSRRTQGGHDHGRILLKARLINAGGPSELRGALAFQRPGELLVAMRGRFKESKCGEAAEPDASAEPASKIFLLKGFGAADLDQPETILKAVRAVWACDPGSLARFDPETAKLSTSSTISQEGADEFNVVAELPETETSEQESSAWAAALLTEIEEHEEDQREKEDKDQKNEELRSKVAQSQVQGQIAVPSCEEPCEPLTVRFDPVGTNCQLTVNTDTFEFTKDISLFKDDCNPARPEFTWVDFSPPIAILSANPEAEPAQITLGLFNSGVLDKSIDLGFGIVLEEFTHEQNNFLSGLPDFVGDEGRRLEDLNSLRHPLGQTAAILPGTGGKDSHLSVLNNEAAFEIAFKGLDLQRVQVQALLPHLTPSARNAEIRDNSDVLLKTNDAYHLLRWSGDKWQLIHKLKRTPRQDRFEDHALAHVSDVAADSTWKREARLVPFDEKLRGWGFAAVDRDTGNGDLILKPVAEPTLEAALKPIDTWRRPNSRNDFQPGKFFWLKLELPPEIAVFRVTSVRSSIDSVICLYDANLEYLAGDDDSHPSEKRSAQLDYRVKNEKPPAWIRISEYGKNEDLPENLVVSLEIIDTVTTSGDPRSECENQHVEMPEPDYFGLPFIDTNIAGLIAAKDDPKMLATLANGVFTKTLPGAFELVAVQVDGGLTLSYVTFLKNGVRSVLRPDAETLEFKPFLTLQGDPPPNTGTLVRAIGEILSRFGETERNLLGQTIVNEGVEAWSVTTIHNEEPRQLLFLEQGNNNAIIALSSPNSDDGILTNIVRYVTTNDWPTVTDVQTDPLVLEVRTRACATAAAECPRKLVHLGTISGGVFPQTVIGDDPVDSPLFARWVEIFTDTVARKPDAVFNQEVYQGTGVAGLDAFRLLRSGPVYLVGPNGWACSDAPRLPMRSLEMERLLAAMRLEFDPGWQTSPASYCDNAHFSIEVGPTGVPNGAILTRFASDNRLRLLRIPFNNPADIAVTESSEQVPNSLVMKLHEDFSTRLRSKGAEALSSMDLLDEFELSEKRHAWVFGDGSGTDGNNDTHKAWTLAYMYPNPLPNGVEEADLMLPCLFTELIVALPPDTDGEREVIEAALDSIRPVVKKADSCIGVDGALINVWANPDGGYSAFFQEIRRRGALLERSSLDGTQLASMFTLASQGDDPNMLASMFAGAQEGLQQVKGTANMVATFSRGGEPREIMVDMRAMNGLLEPAQSNLMRQLVKVLDDMSKHRIELEFSSLELECVTREPCRSLTGRWISIERRQELGRVAIKLDSEGKGIESYALAIGRHPSHDLVSDLAQNLSSDVGSIFDVLDGGSSQLAANVLTGAVFFRETSGSPWQKLGNFPEKPPDGDLSYDKLKIPRYESLRRILREGVEFYDLQWLLGTDKLNPLLGVAIAFKRPGLPLGLVAWETIKYNGAKGPLYLRDINKRLPVDEIAAHFNSGKLLGATKGLWLPSRKLGSPQVLVPLASWTEHEIVITALYFIANGGYLEPTFLFSPDCKGHPNSLSNLVVGLSSLTADSSGRCSSIEDEITLLIAGELPSRGLVASEKSWHWFDISELKTDHESAMHAFAVALPAQEGRIRDIELVQEEGRALAIAADNQVWWRSSAKGVTRLGRFLNVDIGNRSHLRLLSRVADLELPTPPEHGQIIAVDRMLRADLTTKRTAILAEKDLVDLRTIDVRSPILPQLPERYLEEGIVLLRQDKEFPVLFELDAAGMVGGPISMLDENQVWRDIGILDPPLRESEARFLADMLIEVASKYKRPPQSIDRFSDGSFVICQTGFNGNIDVFNWRSTAHLGQLGVVNTNCSNSLVSSKRLENAFQLVFSGKCSPSNGLMFRAGADWFLGFQNQSGAMKTGCLFGDPDNRLMTPICEHFPVQHPARDPLAILFGKVGTCKEPELTDSHALVELADDRFVVVSEVGTRELFTLGTSPEFVRKAASQLLERVSLENDVRCQANLTLMQLPSLDSITLLEDPCHGVSYLDGDQVKKLLAYEPAERLPMQEELFKKLADFSGALRAIADSSTLYASPTNDHLSIQLKSKDIFVLSLGISEIRVRASISDIDLILSRVSEHIEQPTHVFYRKIEDPVDEGGEIVNVVSLFFVDVLSSIDQALVVGDYASAKSISWLNEGGQEVSLGFPLFGSEPISPIAYDWIKYQSRGEPDYSKVWLENDQPRFYVIVRDDAVYFHLINNKNKYGTCWEIPMVDAYRVFKKLTTGDGIEFFSKNWPYDQIGEPGWYTPLNQDPRLAMYNLGGRC